MITNYNSFVRLNEEQEFGSTTGAKKLGGLLKNMLGSLIGDIKDEFKKSFEDFNKKIGNQKDVKSKIKLTNDYLTKHKTELDKSIEEVNDIPSLKELIEDNLKLVYATIKTSVNQIGDNNFTMAEIFKDAGSKTQKLFNYKSNKFNDDAVKKFTDELILNFGKKYGYEKEDLEQTKVQSQEEQIEDAENNKKTNKDLDKLKDDIKIWFNNEIYKDISSELTDVKKEENVDDINKKIQNISKEVTTNKDSVKKIVNKLIDSDTDTFIKVRDLLGIDKNDALL